MYALRQIIPSNNVRHSTPLHLLALVKSHYAKLDTSNNFNNVFKLFFITVKKMLPPILFPTQIVLGTKCTIRICSQYKNNPDTNCS